MTKLVFRTVNTVGPKELLPIYVILQDELNRFLQDEKDKLEQLIVKVDGKKVKKGDFTKQFNSIFGNTLLGVVDAWYYRILQINIYDLLLSLHDKKVIYDIVYLSPQQDGQVYDYGTSLRTHSSAYLQEPNNHFSEKGLLRMPRIKEYADIATLCI